MTSLPASGRCTAASTYRHSPAWSILEYVAHITVRRRVTRVRVGHLPAERADFVAAEEPLEIRVDGRPLTVTMRTPGHDVELAAGFLVSEGVVHDAADIRTARHCPGSDGPDSGNVVDVFLADHVAPPSPGIERNFTTTSSCGVCGKTSIDAVATESHFGVDDDPLRLSPEALAGFPDVLRSAQTAFDRTGGLHAAALFDGETGAMLVIREDIGRHNAVDKVVGWAVLNGRLPLHGAVLLVSGRAGFELAQKAVMAGIPLLAAVSAPSSLAVELAEAAGLTLVGFLRGDSMVAYSRPDRLETVDSYEAAEPASQAEEAIQQ